MISIALRCSESVRQRALLNALLVLFTRCTGAPLFGALPRSGIGVPFETVEVPNVETLGNGCRVDNTQLLASLREDSEGPALFQQTCDEAELGRMDEPVAGAWP